MQNKVYSFLGLATKAGKTVTGEVACEAAISAKQACIVIIAADSSEASRKTYCDKCSFYNIPYRIYGEKDLLGRYTGKDNRAVVAVLDKGFASRLMELIDLDNQNGGVLIGQ